jgi:hypothetical protein
MRWRDWIYASSEAPAPSNGSSIPEAAQQGPEIDPRVAARDIQRIREMRKRLVQSLSEAVVRSWFDGCRASVIEGVLHLGASTKFRRDYINQEFEIEFENAWKGRVIIEV